VHCDFRPCRRLPPGPASLPRGWDHASYRSLAVLKNFGGFLSLVACSKAYPNLRRVGSLHWRPKKEIPTEGRTHLPRGR